MNGFVHRLKSCVEPVHTAQHSTKIGNLRTLHVQHHFFVHFFALTALRSCPCIRGGGGGWGGYWCGKREKKREQLSPLFFSGYDVTFLWI